MKLATHAVHEKVVAIITLLRKATQKMVPPASTSIIEKYGRDPYLVLVSCILSLRTKDSTSLPASIRLFEHVTTPEQMISYPAAKIEKLIYPVGFYRNKTKQLKILSQQILTQFNGQVPKTREELLSLTGVGLKTANLVLSVAYEIPALCVDTHVHKISNRLGLVKTQTPDETEAALQKVIPEKYWIEYCKLLVMWGQNICVPVSPKCSECVLSPLCPKVGVTRHR